jgi:hypothetical protein
MLPLMDMLNHDRSSPNKIRFNGSAFELVHAGDGIDIGDEVMARDSCSVVGRQHGQVSNVHIHCFRAER